MTYVLDVSSKPKAVILVHGTLWWERLFGKEPKWLTRSALREALDSRGYDVRPFCWTGGNSHRARAKAAAELQKVLEEQSQCRDTRWIVAHSHGGNVALHAASALRQAKSIDGDIKVISLATPFIHAQESPPRFLAKAFVALTLASGAIATINSFALYEDLPTWVRYLSRALAIGTAVHLGLALRGITWHGLSLKSNWRQGFVSRIHSPETQEEKLTVVRGVGDEASAILGLGQFISRLGIGATQFFTPSIILSGGAFIVGVVFSIPGFASGETRVGLMMLTYPYLATSLSALTALCTFGWDAPYATLFARQSVESIPPGSVRVRQLQPFDSRSGLAHSRIYKDSKAAEEIVRLLE